MKQSIDNKLGEIKFRKKLVEQQTEEKHYFDDEFNSEGIEKIIIERMEETRNKIKQLMEKNIPVSPYIEIGAERGQRSLVMENDFGAAGAAVDLSFDMLKSCNYYSAKFNQPKIPLRICTDAYKLPFKSNSIPFIFCYQTLHHFPDPTPIIHEVYRVLSEGGTFLFDDEPYKKNLHINLYKKRNKVYSKEEKGRSFFGRTLDYFFAEESCNEVDYGVVENDKISLKIWKRGLSLFEKKDVQLKSVKVITSQLYSPHNYLNFILTYLLGGHISGVCKKTGVYTRNSSNILESIICPSCKGKDMEITLHKVNGNYSCSNCNRNYPIVDGVLILLKDELFEQLYPEYFNKN